MASLVLGVVGTYFFGPIGGFVGSAIGSMIDNELFPNKAQGPKLNDLAVQVSTYGKAIPLLFGPENRMTGNVIWSTGLIETAQKSKSGGKGGPSTEVTTYTYRLSCAVLVGEGVIGGVKKIWANSKLIYDADATSSADPGATPQGFIGIIPLLLYQKSQKSHAVFDTITVYPGDFTQGPDPTIESYLGVGNVPGYRGSAYVVIKDLQLADFGNRLPNLEFLVEADEGSSSGGTALEICRRCGIDPATVSTAPVADELLGYMIGTQASGTGALQPLALAFNFDVAEVGGGLRLTRRDSSPIAVVPIADLGGHVGGEDRPEAISWSRALETQLPREAAVTFFDPDRDLQQNTQAARRAAGSADNNLSTELPITLTVDAARRLADRLLWEAWQGRATAKASTDDRWAILEAGKKYIFETPAGLEPLRVMRRTRGANGIIDLELRRDRAEIYRSHAPGTPAAIPSKPLEIPGATDLFLLDIPLLLDADENSGFYFGVVGTGAVWRGADVKRALSISADYIEVAPVGFNSTAGDVTGTLADGTTTGFDDVTVLTVSLLRDDMVLFSCSDDAIAAGANACFVGALNSTPNGEILQFGTATLVGPGATYELTHLARGVKGTEFATAVHGANETFVLLEQGVTKRADFGVADLGQNHAFKAVSLLTTESDAATHMFVNTGVGLRPYAPISLGVAGAQGGDYTLTWTGRERLSTGAGLGEETTSYRLRIMNAAESVVEREVVQAGDSFVYTHAMQVTDFGATVTTLHWRVAKISTIFGNGIFAKSVDAIPP